MSVSYALLGLLEQRPNHGYDLKRSYDAYFGYDKPLPYGQVYATLAGALVIVIAAMPLLARITEPQGARME